MLTRHLAILGCASLLLAVTFGTASFSRPSSPFHSDVLLGASLRNALPERNEDVDYAMALEKLTLDAYALHIYDVQRDQTLFEKNSDEVLPLASLTKLAASHTALESLDQDVPIVITREDLETYGDYGFEADEVWGLVPLVTLGLVNSSNDAFVAIGRSHPEFLERMNRDMRKLGLTNTTFYNVTGLDSEGKNGGYGTAREMSLLMERLLYRHPDVLYGTSEIVITIANKEGKSYDVQNTNQVIELLPGAIASKTGYTRLAGGNLIVVIELAPSRPIIITILGSTFEGRFNDMKRIIEALRSTHRPSSSTRSQMTVDVVS